MKHYFASIGLAIMLVHAAICAESSTQTDQTTKIYVEFDHSFTETKRDWTTIWKTDEITKRVQFSSTGSGWFLSRPWNGRKVLVTAKHVVFGYGGLASEDGVPLTETFDSTRSLTRKVFVGPYAISPTMFGLTSDPSLDLVFLVFSEEDEKFVFGNLVSLELNITSLTPGDEVSAWGFPRGQATQSLKRAFVARVIPSANRFILNESLENGFSGGVVTDNSGSACGVISAVLGASAGKSDQTTVATLPSNLFDNVSWIEFSPIIFSEE